MKGVIGPVVSRMGKAVAGICLMGSLVVPVTVPKAYAAETAEAAQAATTDLKVGDSFGGGKVAYIFRQGDRNYVAGQTHGLIAAKEDLGEGFTWEKAIRACKEYRGGGFKDWRLPSKDELTRLYVNRFAIGGFRDRHYYWSSSESDKNDAWDQSFRTGERNLGYKLDNNYVRPVRTF